FLDRLDEAMALAGAGASSARRDQRPQELPLLLTTQAEIHVRTGRWQEAEALLEETIGLAQQTQQIELVGYAKAILARIAGARGLAGYEQLARDALSMTTSKGVESFARHSVALGQLTIGRTDDAVRGFDRLQHLLEDLGLRSPTFVPYRADQIEAVIRGGDRQTAQRLVALFEAEVEGIESPWAEGACTRVQALLVSEGERADVLFDRSSSLLSYHPFEQARTQLVWGESLRRRRLLAASREQLQAAVTTFEHLDAIPWAERARRELRATGARTPRPKPSVLGDLTPQELQVAMTVAEGHTNRETASHLFMSPKTVEHHLSGVYRKLGLQSRTELVRLMGSVHR
ncbi:MAG: LuxR C-terminal-related transcriptional regulator, partial [Acidimicrobiaceae bacterium]|nr:LuxR C-terminal-related transcriptional regulator [Acidimicrobiaceae bacterium]